MYWNGDKRKNYEGDNASWIVTLDVLKLINIVWYLDRSVVE